MSDPFTLSREARKAIFDGQAPRISGRGKCPAKLNEPYALSALVSLTVVKINTKPAQATDEIQQPHWWLKYEILDRRDPDRLLRRLPPVHMEEWERFQHQAPTKEEEADAAQESAYTSSSKGTVNDAGSGPSAQVLKIYAMESHQDRVARKAKAEREIKQRALSERMRELEDAMLTNPNLHRYLNRIERQLRVAEARQRRDAA